MALAPRLYDMATFDATKESIFQFVWGGTDPSYGSKLTIRDHDSNTTVYTGTVTTMNLLHTVPANRLTNGRTYDAFLQVLNSEGTVISDVSNTIIFFCYTTPTLTFTNITEDAIVKNSYLDVILNYEQAQGDVLFQYQVGLYDTTQTLVATSGVKSTESYTQTLTESFSGLENDKNYYLRAAGRTASGLTVDTGYIRVLVRYENTRAFSLLDLANNYHDGNISITSNIISFFCDADPENVAFINDTMADLRDGGTISLSEGEPLHFADNFVFAVSVCGFPKDDKFLTWTDGETECGVLYREAAFDVNNDVNKGYFELLIPGPLGTNYIVDSNFVTPVASAASKYTVWVMKQNGYYEVSAVEEEDAEI